MSCEHLIKMESVFNEMLNINISNFVSGIRKETGDAEELTQIYMVRVVSNWNW